MGVGRGEVGSEWEEGVKIAYWGRGLLWVMSWDCLPI